MKAIHDNCVYLLSCDWSQRSDGTCAKLSSLVSSTVTRCVHQTQWQLRYLPAHHGSSSWVQAVFIEAWSHHIPDEGVLRGSERLHCLYCDVIMLQWKDTSTQLGDLWCAGKYLHWGFLIQSPAGGCYSTQNSRALFRNMCDGNMEYPQTQRSQEGVHEVHELQNVFGHPPGTREHPPGHICTLAGCEVVKHSQNS